MDSELVFIADRPKFVKVDEEWHTVVLTVENKELRVGLNGIKKTIVEAVTNTVGAKLVLGDPERQCKAFFGCIKDLVCLPRCVCLEIFCVEYTHVLQLSKILKTIIRLMNYSYSYSEHLFIYLLSFTI